MTKGIENGRMDLLVSGLKAVSSVIPVAGGLVAELIGQVIPGQRIDRINDFLVEVDKRLSALEIDSSPSENPKFIDIFEDASIQALRALSSERTQILAGFVADCAKQGDETYDLDKRLLQILSDLTDTDLRVLRKHNPFAGFGAAWEWHIEPASMVAYRAMPDEEKNKYDSLSLRWDTSIEMLVRLNLLEVEYELSEDGKGFRPDTRGRTLAVRGYSRTKLGDLLVRRVEGALAAST